MVMNRMKREYNTPKISARLIFFLLWLMALLYLNMSQYLNANTGLLSYAVVGIYCAFICWSVFCAIHHSPVLRFSKTSLFLVGAMFFMASMISSLLNFRIYASFIQLFYNQVFWFAVLWFLHSFLEQDANFQQSQIIKILVIAYYVFAIRYLIWCVWKNDYARGARNCIYYSMMLLPCVFMLNKKVTKVGMLGLAIANAVLSSKRTAFIVLAAAIIIPIVTDELKSKKIVPLLRVMFLTVMAVLLISYISEKYNILLFERLNDLTEDEGSGRLSIYKKVWQAMNGAPLINKVFGHGFNAVAINRVAGSSAHNDLLEVLYDYGIVGGFLYMALIVRLVKNAVRLYRHKSRYAPSYLAAFIMFIGMSMFSHLILYPTYFAFLLIFFVMGSTQLLRLEREKQA